MNLTNEQKRKILNDAPMGMTHAMIKIGAPILTVDYAHKKDYGDRVAYMDNMGLYFEIGHWEVRKLADLQEEAYMEEVEHLIVGKVNLYNAVYPFASSARMFIGSLRIKISGYDFNKCVKELSEAAWMNDDEPQYYDIYKLAYRDMQEAEKRRVLAGSEKRKSIQQKLAKKIKRQRGAINDLERRLRESKADIKRLHDAAANVKAAVLNCIQ